MSFLVEDAPSEVLPESEKAIGIDVGISNFAVFSNGTFVENLRYLAEREERLAIDQIKKDRLPKGSLQRKKANRKVSHIYERLGNLRDNFVHQLSHDIIDE